MPPKVGIIAGGGAFPKLLIDACAAQGRAPFVVALEDNADADMVAGTDHIWARFGAVGRILSSLSKAGVEQVVMTGRFKRPSWRTARPDFRGLRLLPKVLGRPQGDDSMLRFAIELIEAEGMAVVGIDSILPDLMAPEGPFGRRAPDKFATADIRRGFEVATALGAADVGQAVVVQQGIVLGVEAVEGTDALVDRCAGLKRDGPGGVLVKRSKPDQDRRVDMPAIGTTTVERAAAAGLRGVAVEAGATLVADRAAVAAAADEAGLFVIGARPDP